MNSLYAVGEPALEFLRDLFTDQQEYVFDENGERRQMKKPLRMVCLSLCILLVFVIIVFLFLIYKLALEIMKNTEVLEIIFQSETCENKEASENSGCAAMNEKGII